MSQWKKLLGDLNRDTQSLYSGRPQKYTPQKRAYNDQSPSRFHNQTIQKLNTSSLSQEKSFARSFVGRQNEPQNQSKKMKASSSQARLHKDLLKNPDGKMMLQPLESLAMGLQQLDRSRLQLRQPLMGKNQKSLIYQEVQKIKKQFGIFQSIVLKELQRQERLINSMFEEILNKIKEQNENPQRNYDFMANMKQNKREVDLKVHEQLKAQSEIVNTKPFNFNQNKGIKAIPPQKSLRSQKDQKNAYPFQRFFEAMQNLKKNFNQINLIEITPVSSPKGEKNNLGAEGGNSRMKNYLK